MKNHDLLTHPNLELVVTAESAPEANKSIERKNTGKKMIYD